ncbi:uncharacterized protein LOC127873072 [Dreissena polymorpha]|nr:uncharacterized protein LOC127873072 [Dreissena polymorpha]
MFVVKQVMCTDFPLVFMGIKNLTLFQTRRELTCPGYTRLELLQFSGRYRRGEIGDSLIQSQSGAVYLSSEAFVAALQISSEKTCNLGGFIKGARSGPSTPMSDKYTSYDDVVALPCCCPDLLSKWFSRPRPQRWPPQEVLHAISLTDAHVVPVGFKGSPEQSLEWRVCFSLAELHLMQILNECQIQTYKLLKKIAKSCLHPISKDITSYVVKNTILWICEKTPNQSFEKKHLLYRLLDTIEFLRQCIRKNYLPSYMISERNLIAGRLDRLQRRQLGRILDDLKNEQGQLFLRIGNLRDALLVMYKCPNHFREYGEKRDILERTVLMRNWIRESAWKPNMTKAERYRLAEKHKGYKILEREIDGILHVNETQLEEKGWMFTEINDLWMQRLYQLLS